MQLNCIESQVERLESIHLIYQMISKEIYFFFRFVVTDTLYEEKS